LPGSYYVTVEDPVGCVATDTFTIAFNQPPIVNITGTTVICKNSIANWCATPGFSSYLWSNGGTGECINISTPGNYSVQITDTNGCTANDIDALIVVDISPSISFSGGFLNCDTINSHYTYSWTINGQPTTCTGFSCAPTFSGIYAVTVTDTALGCSETASYNYVVPGVFDIASENTVSVFPNPFSENEFKINFRNYPQGIVNIEVFNSFGNLVYKNAHEITSGDETKNITLQSSAAGVYHVLLRTKKGMIVKKIVKN